MRTYQAFILCVAVLTAGFIWASFFTEAPYITFASTLGLVFGGYASKRLIQKRPAFKEEFSERGD